LKIAADCRTHAPACCASDPDTPTQPVVSDVGQTSVTLSWRPGESRTIASTTVQYRKQISAGGGWIDELVPPRSADELERSRRSVDDGLREFVVEGLEPATGYLVRVTVDSFGKLASSAVANFDTRQYRWVSAVRNDESAPIQLAQCRFRGLAIFNAKI